MVLQSRRDYLKEIRNRYRKACRKEKSVILGEFCATRGYNRKYAIRLLRKKHQIEGRDIAAQVQQGVKLYRSLGPSEVGPWEHGEAQIYSRRIQGVNRVVQFQSETVALIKLPGSLDQ